MAAIGPEQVGNVAASPQEIAAYYNANRATYAAKETRSLSQVVVPDRNTANAIATRAKAGGTLAAAAAPAGGNAAATTLQDQTRQAYSSVAGQVVAGAAFSAASGAVIGPLQSDFGWVVVKVDSVKSSGGKTLEQATPETAEKLNTDKRKAAIEDVVDKMQTAIDDGSNFDEAAAAAKLAVTSTPLITANGTSTTDAALKLPPEMTPVVKSGFEIVANDPPEIVAIGDKGYVLVSPAQVVPAAPAPLASIRERVAADWTTTEALKRAKAAADAIAAKAAQGASLSDAAKQAGATLPAAMPLAARRIQISNPNGQVPPPLRTLFAVTQGKARVVAVPGGKGFYVVKVNKVVPGNAILQPALIGKVQNDLAQAVAEDYGRQFTAAIAAEMKVKRNESAIAAAKSKLASGGN
jgi:peptidyl-prolyl cis-trans isomerase D